MEKFSPTRGRVLLRLDDFEEDFYGTGIIRPQIAFDKPMIGEVIALGRPALTRKGALIPYSISIGDRVAVPWATGADMKIDGRLHVQCLESQLLGVCE